MKVKFFKRNVKNREEGLTLVEILVAIALLSAVSIMVVTLINTTMNSASRFGNVTTTQNEVSNAVASMQRDLSSAQKVVSATNNSVTVQIRQSSKDYEVTYFAYDPANPGVLPARAITSKLPQYSAIVEIRYDVSAGTTGQRTIVKGHNAVGFSDTEKHHVFDYYDSKNEVIVAPDLEAANSAPASSLSRIERIEFRIAANADGRGTPIQMESSAATTAGGTTTGTIPDSYSSVPECPANFRVNIVPTETTATLSWYSPAGATSYTIYRINSSTNVQEASFVISNPDTLSFLDENLAWGTTYRWTIQANGSGGNSPTCGPINATVVPDEIGFVNVNSLAAIAATKNGAGAESLSRAAETNIPAKSVATTNILSGNRYTVARGLTNQLAWSTGFGVVGYRIYESPNLTTPVATITAAGTQWTQLSSSYGADKLYIIKAYNAGGESVSSAQARLISPPAASTLTAATPDTSTRATSTDTDINVTAANRAPNTQGFRVSLFQTLAANTECEYVTPTARLNFTGATVRDAQAQWGSFNCYRAVPFNDAGPGVSSDIEVKQKPGKFGISSIVNASVFRVIDESKPLPNAYTCWSDAYGTDANPCDLSRPMSSTNYEAIGMFNRSSNSYQSINVTWGQSMNASQGYKIVRDRYATGGNVDQAGTQNATAVYVSGNQSLLYQNEMPGSAYRYTVTATAHNGLSRPSNVAKFLTKPDLPRWMGGNYQDRQFGDGVHTRMYRQIDTGVNRGMGSYMQTYMWVPGGGDSYATQNVNTGWFTAYSNDQTVRGENNRWSKTVLNYDGMSAESDVIGRLGFVNYMGCTRGCGDWTEWEVKWPNYWAGGPAQVYAGGQARGGSVQQGNPNQAEVPNRVTPPAKIEGEDCGIKQEDSTGYTTYCEYGQGIPPAPQGLAVLSNTDNDYLIGWNAWQGITKYAVKVTIDGVTTTTNVTTNSINITVPDGSSASVSVTGTNELTTSPASAALKIEQPLDVPADVTLTTITNSSVTVGWSTVTNATSYVISYTTNGVTKTVNSTTPKVTISGLTSNTNYIIRITAKSATATSEQSVAKSFITKN
jgi:type II secretory pathway component PulJ